MNLAEEHEVPEHGYGMGYQESVAIECRSLFGMEPDEFYRRQVGLVLDDIPDSLYGDSKELKSRKFRFRQLLDRIKLHKKARKAGMRMTDKCDLDLGSGKRVLDLAAGEGDTSRYLATTGATVESRDIEPFLVGRGKEKDAEVRKGVEPSEEVVNEIRKNANRVLGDVNYAHGDYSKTKESVGEGDQFDVISCLSRSFIYLGERENYVKTLKDFHDLLVPGGKVVLQSRDRIKKPAYPWSEEMGTSVCQTPEGNFCMTDERSKTKFVWAMDQEDTTMSDGVAQGIGSRYLEYSDGSTKDLGKVVWDDHITLSNLEGIGDMLREARFINLKLKAENLSSNETEIMYAIVAEKAK